MLPAAMQPGVFALVLITGFLASVLHGATGMAGGLVMAAVFSHLLGIKVAVPMITVVLILSHLTRGFLFQKDIDWQLVRRVLLFGTPTIVLGSVIFGYLEGSLIALVFALVLIASFPIKYWARYRGIRTGPKTLAVASSIWGLLAGNVTAPGFFLAPFLLGTGMNRMAFAGTLATVTLVMNVLKTSVFSLTALLTPSLFLLGLVIGLVTVPGNMLGKKILERLSDRAHRRIIDLLTLILIADFLYLAFTQ